MFTDLDKIENNDGRYGSYGNAETERPCGGGVCMKKKWGGKTVHVVIKYLFRSFL
jgi:hypothetical protein